MRFSIDTIKFLMLALTACATSAAPADASPDAVDLPSGTNVADGSNAFGFIAHGAYFSFIITPNACINFDQFSVNVVTDVTVPPPHVCEIFTGSRCTGQFDFIVGRGVGNGDIQSLNVARFNNLSWRCA